MANLYIYTHIHVRTYIYTKDLIYEMIKFLKFKEKKQTHLFIIVEIKINKIASIVIYIYLHNNKARENN